ncbi:hypothetical protein O1M63_29040 [Streptomyces mirabilis]|nr:hypothetical protein [Streptomyces mirabilis]
MSTAYNLYVNLQAQTGGLTGGLRQSATQLRQFDGQLQQVNRTLLETGSATQRLARLQASASADAVLGQARVTAALERTTAAQRTAAAAAERSGRAQALSASLAAKAERERAAAAAAGSAPCEPRLSRSPWRPARRRRRAGVRLRRRPPRTPPRRGDTGRAGADGAGGAGRCRAGCCCPRGWHLGAGDAGPAGSRCAGHADADCPQ